MALKGKCRICSKPAGMMDEICLSCYREYRKHKKHCERVESKFPPRQLIGDWVRADREFDFKHGKPWAIDIDKDGNPHWCDGETKEETEALEFCSTGADHD